MNYNVHTLSNGIRVVHIPSVTPVCYCGLIVNTGSRDEAPDEEGMAHFIEHTVFKGTHKRKAYHILSRLDEVGGELNAYTTKEETVVHAAFLRRDFDRAAELISDMVFNSIFPEKELAKEKEVIADEISSYKDTPSELIFDDFEELIYPHASFGHNILGTPESLSHFQSDNVRGFISAKYNTDNIVFSVLGSMSWNDVIRMAEKHLGHIPENRRQWHRDVPAANPQFCVRQNKGTNQGHVVMGNIAPDAYNRKRLPMYMLSNMLGGPCMNSRLSLVLREKNGIAYNVETEYNPFTDTGLFTIYFGTDAENIDRSLRIVNRELTRICSQPLSDIQLRKLKRQITGQLLMSADDGENQMLSVGRSVLLYGVADTIEASCRNIETVTSEDILSVARDVIDPSLMSILIYT